jgi:pimeloyl-ACP methyl ester carboxylesterase
MELHVERYGTGRPVLCIHGFGANSATWKRLAPYLADDCELILVDLKGFGASPKPRDGKYSLEDQVELLAEFVAGQQLDRIVIMGHSLGGGIAVLLTAALRARGHAVDGLILIDAAVPLQPMPWYMTLLLIPGVNRLMFRVPLATTFRHIRRSAYYNTAAGSEEKTRAYMTAFADPNYPYVLRRTVHQLLSPALFTAWVRAARSLSLPTLLLWGRNDRLVPVRHAEYYRKRIPKAQLTIFEQCGHAPQEEHPEATAGAIRDFLKSL